jgi:hypothetical protein
MEKKAKHGRPSIFERGPQHQDHAKMNAHILRDAMAVQRRNDEKVANCTHAKVQCEWYELVIIAQ